MAVLIDSSDFIGMERRGLQPAELVALGPDEPVAPASVSMSELLFGAERTNTPKRRARRERFVEAILSIVPVLPFGVADARMHAPVWAGLATSGQMIGAHDLLIAPTRWFRATTCSPTTCANLAACPASLCGSRSGPGDIVTQGNIRPRSMTRTV